MGGVLWTQQVMRQTVGEFHRERPSVALCIVVMATVSCCWQGPARSQGLAYAPLTRVWFRGLSLLMHLNVPVHP